MAGFREKGKGFSLFPSAFSLQAAFFSSLSSPSHPLVHIVVTVDAGDAEPGPIGA
jgi:hypothetical protein